MDGTAQPLFTVTEAVREAVPALIGIWGYSDSGKTYSALRLARGLVGPEGKIVLIDTENRRAKFYAGLFGGWHHIDMQPPFTPARYTAAYNAAMQAGANVVIVDSQSHVWEGEGGVLDQADASTSKGLQKWKAPKTAYKRMTNALFRAPVHMIFCIRAKEKFVQNSKGEIASGGDVPICDARFIYEMTVALRMESGTRKPMSPIKAPDAIAHAFKPGQFITEECGEALAAWLAQGTVVDHEALAWQTEAREAAAKGTEVLRAWWKENVTKAIKPKLTPIVAELQNTADQADADMREGRIVVDAANDGNPLEDQFTNAGGAADDSVAGANQEGEPMSAPAAPGSLPSLPPKPTRPQFKAWADAAVAGMMSLSDNEVAAFRQQHAAVIAKLDEAHPDIGQKLHAAMGAA